MIEKVLLIRCNGKVDFLLLMLKLESIYKDQFEWEDGSKLFDYNPYEENHYLDNMTIYVCVETNKTISYILNATTIEDFRKKDMLYDLINTNYYDLKDIINKFLATKTSTKHFEDLKCGEFKHCDECPLHKFNCDFVQDTQKTFREIIIEIERTFREAKEKYEKGELIWRM